MKPIIAFYLPSLNGGGAERVMLTLANEIVKRGYTVDLVLANAVGPYLSDVSPFINLVNLRSSRVITSLPSFVKYIIKRKPSVILSAMGHANLISLIAVKIANTRTRVVVSIHNNVTSQRVNNKQSFKQSILIFLVKIFYKFSDHIIAVSNGVADSASINFNIPRENIKVIYNPVVTKQLIELSKVHISYPWLKKVSNLVIIAAGRLTKQKDFSTLINAFAIVRNEINASLIIIGEGPLRSDLESLITKLSLQESIFLPGFVDNPFAVMKKAQLFVLSSAWEGLPTVLIEAMACGTPVVSTDCPSGPMEILENGKYGKLVPVGDVDLLARAMIQSLTDDAHPDVVGRASFFSDENAVNEYLRILVPNVL